jgi:hypothetical protein
MMRAHERDVLACPAMRWLGIHSYGIGTYQVLPRGICLSVTHILAAGRDGSRSSICVYIQLTKLAACDLSTPFLMAFPMALRMSSDAALPNIDGHGDAVCIVFAGFVVHNACAVFAGFVGHQGSHVAQDRHDGARQKSCAQNARA